MFSGMGHLELDFSAIPKLYGPENYWHWHMLMRSYLEAADLWKDDHPKDNPHAKFILLASVQTDKVQPGYAEMSPKQIYQNLAELFRPF